MCHFLTRNYHTTGKFGGERMFGEFTLFQCLVEWSLANEWISQRVINCITTILVWWKYFTCQTFSLCSNYCFDLRVFKTASSMYISVCMRVCVCILVFMCVCVYLCACVYLCVCMCVHVCVCVNVWMCVVLTGSKYIKVGHWDW